MLNTALADSWSFFRNHIFTIAIIILPIAIPVEIASAIYQTQFMTDPITLSELLIPMSISFFAYPLYGIAVIFYISSRITGEHISTSRLWQLGRKYWLAFIMLQLLSGIAIGLGLMLFIIPGIIFALRFAFAKFELLFMNQHPVDAMKNSWTSTSAYMWDLLAGYLLITIALYIPLYLFVFPFDQESEYFFLVNSVSNIVYAVLSAFYTIFTYRMYEFSCEKKSDLYEQ